jgi:DegV family protein with EDD domain
MSVGQFPCQSPGEKRVTDSAGDREQSIPSGRSFSEPPPIEPDARLASGAVNRPLRISYVDGRRLRRSILAGIQHVTQDREELDRINVFPVPDGDTGTNLALTLSSIADAVRPLDSNSLSAVADVAAEASVMAARGNSGMLFSRFMLTFSDLVRGHERLGSVELAEALGGASSSLDDVLENPREGTIITVARDMAVEAERRAAAGNGDIYYWLNDMHVAAERSLARTQDMLQALREAGVVDAGAKGFVSFFDGIIQFIEGRIRSDVLEESGDARSLYAAREAGVGADEGRFCTQIAVRGPDLPDDMTIREAIHELGTSTIVLHAGNLAKVHIHADDPAAVIKVLTDFGEIVSERIEDTLLSGTTRHIAVVVDSASDLPREWTERHGVSVVPLQVTIGDRTFRDGVDLDAAGLYERMHGSDAKVTVTTSQPTPRAFIDAYESGLARGAEAILGIYISSHISGTYGTGAAALRGMEGVEGIALDSGSGSLGTGLLAVRAVELLDQGMDLEDVVRELKRVRDQSNVFFSVDTMEYLLRSGRVSRAKAWFGGMLDLKPILSFAEDRRLAAVGRGRGMDAVRDRVFDLLDERLIEAERYRFGVVHFAAEEWMHHIVDELNRRYEPLEILCGPPSSAIGVHVGPGAWALAYQIED